jgi:hypothetical protein
MYIPTPRRFFSWKRFPPGYLHNLGRLLISLCTLYFLFIYQKTVEKGDRTLRFIHGIMGIWTKRVLRSEKQISGISTLEILESDAIGSQKRRATLV